MSSTITQTELAGLVGTSRQNVYKAITSGHIHTKKVRGKKKIVLNHELTQLWIETQAAKNQKTVNLKSSSKSSDKKGDKTDLTDLQREKTIEEIGRIKAERRLKELKYAREREELIDKETQASVLFHYLEALNINMLEFPDMVIDALTDKIKSGASRGDNIKLMRDMIQGQIKSTKKQIEERLKN